MELIKYSICILLFGFIVPIFFIFEIFAVIPAFHEPGSFFYIWNIIIGTFIVFNLEGNMMQCILTDASVDFESVQSPPRSELEDTTEAKTGFDWHWCEYCEQMTPPRSWHCKECKACILKRDHHCTYFGCCIGYKNYRYFVLCSVYLLIGCLYVFVYNSLYILVLNGHIFLNWRELIKIAYPIAAVCYKTSFNNFCILLYSLNIVILAGSIFLVSYHCSNIRRGVVSYERKKGCRYNGDYIENMKEIFGKRMHLVWLSPFIKSELLDDATWSTRNGIVNEKKESLTLQIY